MIMWIVLVWKHAGFLSALAVITWCLWFIPTIHPNLLRQKILSLANLCSCKHVSPPHTHTHWCVIGNKKQPLKGQSNKIFLLTCWNLTKAGNQKNPQQVVYFFPSTASHLMTSELYTLAYLQYVLSSGCSRWGSPRQLWPHAGEIRKKALNKDKTDRWRRLGVLSLLRRLLSHQDHPLILSIFPPVCPVLPAEHPKRLRFGPRWGDYWKEPPQTGH